MTVMMVEPSGFRTDWAGGSMTRAFETAVDRYESRLAGFRAIEDVARGADD